MDTLSWMGLIFACFGIIIGVAASTRARSRMERVGWAAVGFGSVITAFHVAGSVEVEFDRKVDQFLTYSAILLMVSGMFTAVFAVRKQYGKGPKTSNE